MSHRFRCASIICAALVLGMAHIPTHAHQRATPTMNRLSIEVVPGDIIAQQEGGSWHVVKILQVDSFPDGTSTAHCLSYNNSNSKPSATSIATLGVRVWHA